MFLKPKTKSQFSGGFLLFWITEFKAVAFPKAYFPGFEPWTKLGTCISRTWVIKATRLFFFVCFPTEPLEANEFLAFRLIGICIWLSPAITVLAAHRTSSWSFFPYWEYAPSPQWVHSGWKACVLKCLFIPHVLHLFLRHVHVSVNTRGCSCWR